VTRAGGSPSTDPQEEPFDILDDEGNPTGRTKPRRDVHRDGDWHRGLHVWIGTMIAGVPHVVLQRRSMTKDTYPGALDVTIGGHFRAGETLEETVREAEEEIGLALTVADLVPIGRRWVRDGVPPTRDNELNEVYGVRCGQPLGAYRLHPEEVDAIVAISITDLLALVRGEVARVSAIEHPRGATAAREIVVTCDETTFYEPVYPVATLESLLRVIAGETPEPWTIRHP
jgi:isopentenyldiphosphate isomerase